MTTSSQSDSNKGNPEKKPAGPRTPYPIEHPGIGKQPGVEPDYIPGATPEDLPKL